MLCLAVPAYADSQRTSPNNAADWPAAIAQWRDQLDRVPGDARARQQLAIAHNNYGIQLLEQGRYSEAAREIEAALSLEPSNQQFTSNLLVSHLQAAQTASQAHQVQQARTAIMKALKVDPRSAQAYAMLGELEYDSQRLKEARKAWQQALALDPALPGLAEKLSQLNDELPVETELEKWSQGSFDIRYSEALKQATGYDLGLTLQRARRVVGSDFTYWPRHKLVVLVYAAEEFRKLRQDLPDWVAGQFDGKIRVPWPSHDLGQASVTRTLFHEYTHAVVYEVAKGRLPTWFNEGLAEYEAWKDGTPPWTLLRQAAAANRLLPWEQLANQFSGSVPAEQVGLAYEQSHSIVRYLAGRYGFWRIRRVLKAVAEGADLDAALAAEFRLKLSRLQDNWRAGLQDQLYRAPTTR